VTSSSTKGAKGRPAKGSGRGTAIRLLSEGAALVNEWVAICDQGDLKAVWRGSPDEAKLDGFRHQQEPGKQDHTDQVYGRVRPADG